MRVYTTDEARKYLADHGMYLGPVLIKRLARKYGRKVGRRYFIPHKALVDLLEGRIEIPPKGHNK